MKILILGDLHGAIPVIHYKDFDAVIAPGDFCSSDVIRELVFEQIRTGKSWIELAGGKNKAKKLAKQSIASGRKVLEFLNSLGKPVYVVPGNTDWYGSPTLEWSFLRINHYKEMISGLKNVIDVHLKRVQLGDYDIIGYGLSSGPELPDEILPDELREKQKKYLETVTKLNKLFDTTRQVIFLSHNVPFNTSLDRITNRKSPAFGKHYGSMIAREMVIEHQPVLAIGGHIHEHFGKCRLGRTVCVNAGYGPGVNILADFGEKLRLRFWRRRNDSKL